MQVTVKQDTWLPAQTALVEVISGSDGLFICTSQRVDAWPRRIKTGVNKIRCMIREEAAPITLKTGEIIGEVMQIEQGGCNKQSTGQHGEGAESKAERKTGTRGKRRLA